MDQKFNYRCDNCNKLLFRGNLKEGEVEIKCTKCGKVSSENITSAQRILKQLKKEIASR